MHTKEALKLKWNDQNARISIILSLSFDEIAYVELRDLTATMGGRSGSGPQLT